MSCGSEAEGGDSRAERKRKWGGVDAERGSLKEGKKEETFGRDKKSFLRDPMWRLYRN